MALISVQPWTKLLYVIIEDNGQPWFGVSTIDAEGRTKDSYTLKDLLQDWSIPLTAGH